MGGGGGGGGGGSTSTQLQQAADQIHTDQTSAYQPAAFGTFQNLVNAADMITSQPFVPYGPEQFNQNWDNWPYYIAPRNLYEEQFMANAGNLYQYAAPYIQQAGQMTNDVYNQAGNFGWGTLNNASNMVAGGLPYLQGGSQYIQGAFPYVGQGANLTQMGTREVPRLSGQDIASYLSPYQQYVINATMANIAENDQRQQEDILGNAVRVGALGGDRQAVAQAELARQQALAANQTLSGLWNQNYSQALQTAQGQQAVQAANLQRQLQGGQGMGQLGATQGGLGSQYANVGALQGALGSQMGNLAGVGNQLASTQGQLASQMGNLGLANQQAASQQLNALSGAGSLERQFEQNRLNAIYEQYLREQGFPYQALQYRAGIQMPAGGGMGGQQLGIGDQLSNMYGITNSMTSGGQGGGGSGGGFNPMSMIGGMMGKGMSAGGGVPDDLYADGGAINPFAFAEGGLVVPGMGIRQHAANPIPALPIQNVKPEYGSPVHFMPKTQPPSGGKGGGKGGGAKPPKNQMPKMPKMPTGKSAQEQGEKIAEATVQKENTGPGLKDPNETATGEAPDKQQSAIPDAAGTDSEAIKGNESADQLQGDAGNDPLNAFASDTGGEDYFGGESADDLGGNPFGDDLGGGMGEDFGGGFDEADFGDFGGDMGGGFDEADFGGGDDFLGGGGGGMDFGGGFGMGKGTGGVVGYDEGGEVEDDYDFSVEDGADELSGDEEDDTIDEKDDDEEEQQLPEIVVKPEDGATEGGKGESPQPDNPFRQDMGRYGDAIKRIESGGGKYHLLGPVTRTGDRAYGAYQVMGNNIPSWSKAALGQSMTPQQFLSDPAAQDAVFNHRFGQYVNKYGPQGAARAWFAGEGGMNNMGRRDQLGTSVAKYDRMFSNYLGRPQTASAMASGDRPMQWDGRNYTPSSAMQRVIDEGRRRSMSGAALAADDLQDGASPMAAFAPEPEDPRFNDAMQAATRAWQTDPALRQASMSLQRDLGNDPRFEEAAEAATRAWDRKDPSLIDALGGLQKDLGVPPGAAPQPAPHAPTSASAPQRLGAPQDIRPPAQRSPAMRQSAPENAPMRQQQPPMGMMRSFGPEGGELMPVDRGGNMGPSFNPSHAIGQMLRPGSPFWQGVAASPARRPLGSVMDGLGAHIGSGQMMAPQMRQAPSVVGDRLAQRAYNPMSPEAIFERTGKWPQAVRDPNQPGRLWKFTPPSATLDESGRVVEKGQRGRTGDRPSPTERMVEAIKREHKEKTGETLSTEQAIQRYRSSQRPEQADQRRDLTWRRNQALADWKLERTDRQKLPEERRSKADIFRSYGLDEQGNPLQQGAAPQPATAPQAAPQAAPQQPKPAEQKPAEAKPEAKPETKLRQPNEAEQKQMMSAINQFKGKFSKEQIINIFRSEAAKRGIDPTWLERNYPN